MPEFVRIALFSIGLTVILLTSCKENIPGCTDQTADNYQIEANEENGSCTYSGEITFWYDNQTRDSLLSNDLESVMPRVNDTIGTNILPDFILWSAEPECQTSSIGRLDVNLGNQKSKMIHFTVALNHVNNIYWEDSIIVDHNGCELYQMIW